MKFNGDPAVDVVVLLAESRTGCVLNVVALAALADPVMRRIVALHDDRHAVLHAQSVIAS